MEQKIIERCAITGADNSVSYEAINALSGRYPFAEWAMLLSSRELMLPLKQARPRFPTLHWLLDFRKNCPNVRHTVHLCGDMLQELINGQGALVEYLDRCDGAQLNFGFRDGGKFLLGDAHAVSKLVQRVQDLQHLDIILQYGGAYEKLASAFVGLPNVSILVDGSAGAGQLPERWPAPHPDFRTGYAGGLNPDVVVNELRKIGEVLPEGYVLPRIDAETGYRDVIRDGDGKIISDEFSLAKVERMLAAVELFVAGPAGRHDLTRKPELEGPRR